jgi:riboflavin kinase/FMN adenylyltransferase
MSVLFRDFSGPAISPRGSVVCIGAFDGLHLGHQHVLNVARARADAAGLDLVVVSFEPLPREYFGKQDPPARLILAGQKFRQLRALGVDAVGLLRFNKALAQTSAASFISELLVKRLNARQVLVGPDFFFGSGRQGDLAMLQSVGLASGFSAEAVAAQQHQAQRISSSLIRTDLQHGRLHEAAQKLGRAYSIEGKVVRGKQLGRTLGYPTANIRLQRKKPALMGIYASNRLRASRVWARGRRSTAANRSWRPICSISTMTSTAGASVSNSYASCGMRSNSILSMLW